MNWEDFMGHLKRKLTKLVAGLLMVAMLTQSISMSVLAAEIPNEGSSIEAITAVSGNEDENISVITGDLGDDGVSGNNEVEGEYNFSELSWGQFYIDYRFTYNFADTDPYGYCEIFMEQYTNQNQLISTYSVGSYGKNEFEESDRIQLCADTTKVRFITIENGVESTKYVSHMYDRSLSKTQPTFQIGVLNAGVSTLIIPWSVAGYMANTEGNSEYISVDINLLDEGNKNRKIEDTLYVSKFTMSGKLEIENLSENTTYHGSMRIYLKDVEEELIFEQTIPISVFTTKSNTTYTFSQIIPDATLRKLITNSIYGMDENAQTVTKEQLEEVSYISASKEEGDTGVQSLEGIEYLTRLERIYLEDHSISDISAIDWGKLNDLKTVNLIGNNITTASDFSGATLLERLDLRSNKLTASAIFQIRNTLRRNCDFDASNQRIGTFSIVAEPTYYKVNGNVPVIVLIKGFADNQADNKVDFSIDGTKVAFVNKSDYSNSKWLYQSEDLSEGAHSLSVSVNGVTQTTQFSVASQDYSFEKNIVDPEESYFTIRIQSTLSDNSLFEDFDAVKVVSSSDSSMVVGDLSNSNSYKGYSDKRYQIIGEGNSFYCEGYYNIKELYYSFESCYNILPEGSYDLQLTKGETTTVIEDVLEVTASKAYVTEVNGTSDYNGTDGYIYLNVSGIHLDPSKLEYAVTYERASLPVKYMSAKKTGNGCIIKLQRDNWTYLEGDRIKVVISAKDGYNVTILKDSCNIYASIGVFYKELNPDLSSYELAYTSDYSPKEVRVEVKKLENYNSTDGILIASGTATTTQDGFVQVPLLDEDGNVPKYEYSYYQFLIYFDNQLVSDTKEHDGKSYSTVREEYWYFDPGSSILQGTDSCEFSYRGKLNYEDYDSAQEQSAISAKLSISDNQIAAINEFDFYDSEGKLYIAGEVPTKDLLPGTYKIQIDISDQVLSSSKIEVLPNEKFYLDYIWANWTSDSNIQMGFDTLNTSETDEYAIEVFDPKGNPVPNLTITERSRYSNFIYYNITGLSRTSAYRNYWIKITHKTLGAPYNYDGDAEYYEDALGEYCSIGYSSMYFFTDGSRTVGIRGNNIQFPITVSAYIPYDTESVATMNATKADENGRVYFTKEFINALPNKDRLYDLVVTDASGRSEVYTGRCLGLDESQTKSVPLTAITVSPKTTSLTVSQTESLSVTYTPADATDIPSVTWSSSNSGIASVSTTGAVTGVAVGSATITATCGAFTSTCKVTVTDRVQTPVATPSPQDGAIDKNATVTITTATPSATIYYTLDGSEPTNKSSVYKAAITISKAMTIKAKAYKSGYDASETVMFEYVLKTYTISFDANGGTNAPQSQVLYKGDYLDSTKILNPTKDGYRFMGWFAGGAELNPLAAIDSSATYVARWQEAPTLSEPTANYDNGTTLLDESVIKLETNEADAIIYYTTDGSEPTKDSSRYNDGIVIDKLGSGDQNYVVKAFATKEGFKNSSVATFTYVLIDKDESFGDILPKDIPEDDIPGQMWIAGLEESYKYARVSIKPDVRVYYKNRLLVLNKDYTITYANNVNVGEASLTVKGKGNYTGTYFESFTITKKPLTSMDIVATSPLVVENGKVIKSVPTLKDNGKTMAFNKYGKKDYVVLYDESASYKEPGKYSITVTGTNNYTGSIEVVETILDKEIEKLISKTSVSKIAYQTYTGSEITPAITVKYGKTILVEDVDYTVVYENNVAVGTASVTIKGKGDYFGSKKVNYSILGKDLRYVKVTNGWVNSFVYIPGKAVYEQPQLVLFYQKSKKATAEVVSDNAYSIQYLKNQGVGTATVIFTGNKEQGYSGSIRKTFKILPNQELANADVAYNDVAIYRKAGAKPSVSVSLNGVTLIEGKDYKVSYANNRKVCLDKASKKTPAIIITGKGNYRGTQKVLFTIQKAPISPLTMTAKDRVYNGKANAFATSISIVDVDGKALTSGVDYEKTLTYWLNGTQLTKTDIVPEGSTVFVRATGKGAYEGTIEASFRVLNKVNLLENAKVVIEAQTYTGKEIAVDKDDITVSVKVGKQYIPLQASDYEIIGYSKNINKGTATLTLKGVGTYGGIKKVSFKIVSCKVIEVT